MTIVLIVIFIALAFEYINGFHDTANSIATVVATKVLTPRGAIFLAVVTNLFGALYGTAVAKTIATGLVDSSVGGSQIVLIGALMGGITWNLITWWFGLPSSSSHGLIGGLCGAAIAASGSWDVLLWGKPGISAWWDGTGLLFKVVLPMIASPILGFVCGWLVMSVLYFFLRNWKPKTVNGVFSPLQLLSSAYMGFSHGLSDAQKTMGIIFLALVGAAGSGYLDKLPSWANWFYQPAESSAIAHSYIRLAEDQFKQENTDAGKKYLEKASKLKAPEVYWMKFHNFKDGKNGYEQDESSALMFLKMAADNNILPAVELYTKAQEAGLYGLKPNAQAAEEFRRQHKKALPVNPLALSYPKSVKSSGVFQEMPTDPKEQVAWLEKLISERDNAPAKVLLGNLLVEGKGVEKNVERAKKLFEEASKKPDHDGMYNLGVLALRNGDFEKAQTYFSNIVNHESIPVWIKVICAITMACGTAAGGWKIIKTLGHKMVKLHPVHGFAAETTGATVLMTAGNLGMPVSTTHAITTSIMGVGFAKSKRALNLQVVGRILVAWVLTLPAAGIVAYLIVKLLMMLGLSL